MGGGTSNKSGSNVSAYAGMNLRQIQGEHTYISDAKQTNPNYNPRSIEWSYNCQRCVPTYELRRRGYDVKVKPRPTETVGGIFFPQRKVPSRNDPLSRNPFSIWKPPESIYCPNGQIDIENKLKEWGDGSRAEIAVLWAGGHGSGHVFVAEQVGGKTHFIDPQTGKDGVAYYFDNCDKTQIYICRTDNKDLSEIISECCY